MSMSDDTADASGCERIVERRDDGCILHFVERDAVDASRRPSRIRPSISSNGERGAKKKDARRRDRILPIDGQR
jgi:hypothetical protein